MAGIPNTRNWKANEIPDFAGHRYLLVVTGDVQVTATNLTPKLSAHVPQGINPRIYMLDLKIVSSGGIGAPLVYYKHVQYTKVTSGHQYDEVDILFNGKIIKRIKVGHPKSLKAGREKEAGQEIIGRTSVAWARRSSCRALPVAWRARDRYNLRSALQNQRVAESTAPKLWMRFLFPFVAPNAATSTTWSRHRGTPPRIARAGDAAVVPQDP